MCNKSYNKKWYLSCPYCKKNNSKSSNESAHYWTKCGKCKKKFDFTEHGSCPYCKESRESSDSKNSTYNRGTSIAFIISLLILFAFAAYGYLPYGDLFSAMIFGFMGLVVGLVVFAIIIVIYEHYYLT